MRGFVLFGICLVITAFTTPDEKGVTTGRKVVRTSKKMRISDTVKRIVVVKSQRKLYAYFKDTFKVYRCALGANPVGHKRREGDNKTPEGTYYISLKNPKSRGYRSLKISYPNSRDRAQARKKGVSPGGDIFIHGLWWPSQDPETHWLYDWTWGCVALNNQEILELYKWTVVKTPITIKP